MKLQKKQLAILLSCVLTGCVGSTTTSSSSATPSPAPAPYVSAQILVNNGNSIIQIDPQTTSTSVSLSNIGSGTASNIVLALDPNSLLVQEGKVGIADNNCSNLISGSLCSFKINTQNLTALDNDKSVYINLSYQNPDGLTTNTTISIVISDGVITEVVPYSDTIYPTEVNGSSYQLIEVKNTGVSAAVIDDIKKTGEGFTLNIDASLYGSLTPCSNTLVLESVSASNTCFILAKLDIENPGSAKSGDLEISSHIGDSSPQIDMFHLVSQKKFAAIFNYYIGQGNQNNTLPIFYTSNNGSYWESASAFPIESQADIAPYSLINDAKGNLYFKSNASSDLNLIDYHNNTVSNYGRAQANTSYANNIFTYESSVFYTGSIISSGQGQMSALFNSSDFVNSIAANSSIVYFTSKLNIVQNLGSPSSIANFTGATEASNPGSQWQVLASDTNLFAFHILGYGAVNLSATTISNKFPNGKGGIYDYNINSQEWKGIGYLTANDPLMFSYIDVGANKLYVITINLGTFYYGTNYTESYGLNYFNSMLSYDLSNGSWSQVAESFTAPGVSYGGLGRANGFAMLNSLVATKQ